jgi:hypothetical protein
LIVLLVSTVSHSQGDTTKILFIGNSFSFFNNMPTTFGELATEAGKTVFVDQSTPGGYTLQQHSVYQQTLDKINSKDWDFVVLQEQSQLPSWYPERETQMYPYAILLDELIHQNNLCTETMFFMTWGHKNGDLGILQQGGTDSYEAMQQRLREGYTEIADSLSALISPVGMAWKTARQQLPLLNLYATDDYHPNAEGSYLAACVFYSSIFQDSLNSIPYYGTINQADAENFQAIATSTVLDSLPEWNITLGSVKICPNEDFVLTPDLGFRILSSSGNGILSPEFYTPSIDDIFNGGFTLGINTNNLCPSQSRDLFVEILETQNVISSFNFVINDLDVVFTDSSTNSFDYFWDFGDGSTSNLQNPEHSYASEGNYIVTQIVTDSCEAVFDTSIVEISIILQTLREDAKIIDFQIFPNPTNSYIFIESNFKINELSICEISSGKILLQKHYEKSKISLNLNSLDKSIYFLKIETDEGMFTKKIVKM